MVTQHNTDHNIVKVNTLDSGTLPGLDAAESLNPQPSFSDESGTALIASSETRYNFSCVVCTLAQIRKSIRLKYEDM